MKLMTSSAASSTAGASGLACPRSCEKSPKCGCGHPLGAGDAGQGGPEDLAKPLAHQGKARLGEGQEIRDLGRLPARVERDQGRPDLGQAQPGLKELGPVLQHESHTVAFANAQLVPGAGGQVYQAIELAVGDALPAMDQKRLVRHRARRLLEHLTHVEGAEIAQCRLRRGTGRRVVILQAAQSLPASAFRLSRNPLAARAAGGRLPIPRRWSALPAGRTCRSLARSASHWDRGNIANP